MAFINGTSNANTLFSTADDDLINGLGGNDRIEAGIGAVDGFDDFDSFDGGSGVDTLSYLHASGPVVVTFNGTTGTVQRVDGSDEFRNIENIVGSAFNDVLGSSAANNVLDGSLGIDTVSYANAAGSVQVALTSTGGFSSGAAGNDTLISIENVDGSNFGDEIAGNSGVNILRGLDGDDFFDGGAGNDIIDGGAGSDTARYDNAPSAIIVHLTETGGTARVFDGTDTLISIENIDGSGRGDYIYGNSAANILRGQGGDDLIEGGLGGDVLDGGAGNDAAYYRNETSGIEVRLTATGGTAITSSGIDTLISIENVFGSDFGDVLQGNDSRNILTAGDGDDFIIASGGGDIINGEVGTDTVSYANFAGPAEIRLNAVLSGASSIDTFYSIENAIGSEFGDIIVGTDGANSLFGNGGIDFIDGGSGDDILSGGQGDDILAGGTGTDTATYEHTAGGIFTVLTATGGSTSSADGVDNLFSIENISGSNFDDTISGNDVANILSGAGGNDFLEGGRGNDRLDGGAENDTASYAHAAGGVSVTLSGASGTATGADGNDTLVSIENIIGSSFGDIIIGDGAGNILNGLGGDDTLTGGGGADQFVIGVNSGQDVITDFTDLDTILFDASSGVDDFLDLSFIQFGADTLITWGTHDFLVVKGVNVSEMDASDFSFGTGTTLGSGGEAVSSAVNESTALGSGFHSTDLAMSHVAMDLASHAFLAG